MTALGDRYLAALGVALEAHAGDVRKGTEIPYVAHVLSVSALVLEHGGDEDQAIAALLHDVAEDAGGEARLDEIAGAFGADVAAVVRALSDSLARDATSKAPWWERKVAYLDQLGAAPPTAVLVAVADKVHNVESLVDDYRRGGEDLWNRFNADAGRSGQLWYYARVADVIGGRLDAAEAAGDETEARALEAARPLVERLRLATRQLGELVADQLGADQVTTDLRDASTKEREARQRLAAPEG